MEKNYNLIYKKLNINLNEIDFLVFTSFIIRCKKEIEWIEIKQLSGKKFVFSKKIELVYLVVEKDITIVYKYKEYKLSREEFGEFVEYIYNAIQNYKSIPELNYRTLDPVFFEYMFAVDLPYLTNISFEQKYLDELSIFVNEKEQVKIPDSKYYKMVQSGDIPNIKTHTNLIGQSHEERVKLLINDLVIDKYGSNGQYIILYNDTDIIRDGSHRAAILYLHNVTEPITICRMIFQKNYYTFDRYYSENNSDFNFISILKSTLNTRWIMINGKRSSILRSDSLKGITDEDIRKLKQNKIGICIDLSTKPVSSNTEMLKKFFEYYNLPLSYHNSLLDEACSSYYSSTDYYMYILSQKKQIKGILDIIKNRTAKVIIYCAIGRDRTGVISIILQMLMGCSRMEIIEEYSMTDKIYENKPIGHEKGLTRQSARKYAVMFLDRFEKEYYTVESYLLSIGYTYEDIGLLRESLKRE